MEKQKISSCRSLFFASFYHFSIEMVERGKIATTNTQIRDRSLSWLDTGFSIKRSAVKLVYVPILPHTQLLVKLCCYVSVFHM